MPFCCASSRKQGFRIGLIVGLDVIGDALIKLPVLRALRAARPDAEVHWITAQGATAYSGPLREVTRSLIDVIDDRPTWLKSKRNKNPVGAPPYFHVLIDTRNRWREALYAKNSVPCGIFISPALRFLFSDKRPRLFAPRPRHMVDRMLQQVSLAVGALPPMTGRLDVPAAEMEKARNLLPEGKTYIGLSVGAGNKNKIWPLEKFITVAKEQVVKGRVPVFLLGPQESDLIDVLRRAVPEALLPLQARDVWQSDDMKIEETLAVASLLTLAVANDSGTGHMLAAVDCPLISLFGPTSPVKLAPRVSQGRVLAATDFGGEAMKDIPVAAVLDAVEKILSAQANPAIA